MSRHDSRRNKHNDGYTNRSPMRHDKSANGLSGHREKIRTPKSKDPSRSASTTDNSTASTCMPKQLLQSAQEQLQEISKLRVLRRQTKRNQRENKCEPPPSRFQNQILPDKTKYDLRSKTKSPSGSFQSTPGASRTPSPGPGKHSETPFSNFKHQYFHTIAKRMFENTSKSSEVLIQKSSNQTTSTIPKGHNLKQLPFEAIHNILKVNRQSQRNLPSSLKDAPIKSKLFKNNTPSPTRKTSISNSKESIQTTYTNTGEQLNATYLKSGKDQRLTAPKEGIVQTMEQEVKSLQKELELVQAERRGLALQKKLLKCMADSGPTPSGCAIEIPKAVNAPQTKIYIQKPQQPENLTAVEVQLNSLREQYRKLQEDYNTKVEEVSMVRVEYDSAKRDALALLEKSREGEARVDDLLERLRAIEMEKNKMVGSKDQMLELDQQLTLAKQRYREGQEELDEIKTTMQDQMMQLEEYRNKYLSAQQTVEEQRRQIDIMELENNRISEQVNLEIQRVKTQFQEKLQELTPLPDMLKATQLKLQECEQLRHLAERNVEQLLNQSDELKDQNKSLEKELEELKKNSDTQSEEKSNLRYSLSTGEKKIEEIKSENVKLRATVARLEEVALNNDRRLDEKNHEVLQLQTQLETLREESARQVSRTKDRCETVRRTLQGQISQLECQLAQSRAAARTAQKDRDEIRQRMQAQITSLNDNFEQAQLRIRSLQSHVNYLKSSYTNIFAPEQCTPMGPKPIDGLSS